MSANRLAALTGVGFLVLLIVSSRSEGRATGSAG